MVEVQGLRWSNKIWHDMCRTRICSAVGALWFTSPRAEWFQPPEKSLYTSTTYALEYLLIIIKMVQWTQKLKKNRIIGIISEKGVIHTLFSSFAYSFCTQNKLLLQSDVWNLVLYWKQIIMLSRAYNTSFQRCLTQFSWFGPLPTMTGHTEDNFHFILNCGRKES